MQKPEVVYTPTSYNSAHPSMASSGSALPWWQDAQNANTETHYDFAGTVADGKLEARAVPEANFWQNQPGTDGAVRFAWGDDGHRCVRDSTRVRVQGAFAPAIRGMLTDFCSVPCAASCRRRLRSRPSRGRQRPRARCAPRELGHPPRPFCLSRAWGGTLRRGTDRLQ